MMYGYGFRPNNRLFVGGGVNPLWNDLLAYYTADNTPNDALGNYNGTLVNGATYGTGIINQGFDLDGVNDYVSLPDNMFKPTGDFTVSLWINISNANNKYMFHSGLVSSIEGILFYTNASRFRVWLGNSATTFLLDSSADIILNSLQHYVVTFNSSTKNLKLYLNGTLDKSVTSTINPTFPTTCLTRLGCSTINNNFTPGIIDEVSFFNRELTSTEVTELYNSGSGLQY